MLGSPASVLQALNGFHAGSSVMQQGKLAIAAPLVPAPVPQTLGQALTTSHALLIWH